MENTKTISEVLMYFIPAFLILIGMFLMMKRSLNSQEALIKSFVEKEIQLKAIDDRSERRKNAMPLKLQAYERFVLFLERIDPSSILVRVHTSGMSAAQLQNDLIVTIRAEFEHNLSQQIYVSDYSWEEVKSAKEEMIRIINSSFNRVGNNSSGLQLSTAIFEFILEMDVTPTQRAINFLKSEARKMLE